MRSSVTLEARPNLALVKYWGKKRHGINIPATSSLGITLDNIYTKTTLEIKDETVDGPIIILNGIAQNQNRFKDFFSYAARYISAQRPKELPDSIEKLFSQLHIKSTNNFPTAAGLASSSSGFGALSFGLDALFGSNLSKNELSRIARVGSGSAARTLYGGFVQFEQGKEFATQFRDETFWPDFRIILLTVSAEEKKISSRLGMNTTKLTSPYFPAWVRDSKKCYNEMRSAVLAKDIEKLGSTARLSYMRMFATMISSSPPILYWQPESVEILQKLEELRSNGIAVWETMDAGPQIKLICEENSVQQILNAFQNLPSPPIILSAGKGPEVMETCE